ncbi:hypothetical protein ACQVP2_34015 [Methylobacterium aquaticum]|uniref:hypothetical protein n=1 Tax=Methylobacterium aquaticum TaxID=270351 RepID=UPI003D17EF65
MTVVFFPSDMNWFYAKLALAITEGLREEGHAAEAVPVHDIAAYYDADADHALIVNPAECVESAARVGARDQFLSRLRNYRHRVIVNYDSLRSGWFLRQLKFAESLFTDIVDIGVVPQAESRYVGLRYIWIPEAMWVRPPGGSPLLWTADRPLPWAVIGHINSDRAALVDCLVRSLQPDGFVYLPSLRPFGDNSGLNETQIYAVLARTNLYVWNSHHHHPYHEGLRAIQAVSAGAIPAKIDPLHADQFSDVPWVYPSVDALVRAQRQRGLPALFDDAHSYLSRFPSLGQSLATALNLGAPSSAVSVA